MTPEFQLFLQVILEALTLFVLLVGLLGLIVPVFPGLTVMWLGTLVYALHPKCSRQYDGLEVAPVWADHRPDDHRQYRR